MKLSLHQMEGNNSKNLSNVYQNDLLEVLNVQKKRRKSTFFFESVISIYASYIWLAKMLQYFRMSWKTFMLIGSKIYYKIL
jgi:hypothetical protein